MRVLSLCSGIGGLEFGLSIAEPAATPVQFVEMDKFAQSVLASRWPGVPIHDNVFTFDPSGLGGVDCITAGFPCQPFSLAGERKGVADERWIYPRVIEIIRDTRPRFVFLENVPGLLSKGFGEVLKPLAQLGFNAEWAVFSCSGLGAAHIRKRVFILAYARSIGREREQEHSDEYIQAVPQYNSTELETNSVCQGLPLCGSSGRVEEFPPPSRR